jgi:hypothetical protein
MHFPEFEAPRQSNEKSNDETISYIDMALDIQRTIRDTNSYSRQCTYLGHHILLRLVRRERKLDSDLVQEVRKVAVNNSQGGSILFCHQF